MAPSLTDNKFDPNKDIPDLSGKVYVITGGTYGIGYGISAHLLQYNPAKLYLLGKKEEHGEAAEKQLEAYGDAANVIEFVKCDFEDLGQTDQVAKSLGGKLQRLDGLILNAGIGVGPYAKTRDGIDHHMQINHISQQHLALTLLPHLLTTPNSRLVLQSSEMHRLAPSSVSFASEEDLNTDLGATNLYARTKLAQVLFARLLVTKLEKGELGANAVSVAKQGPWVNATHPGAVDTGQPPQAVEAYGALGKVGVKAVKPFMKEPVEEGCRSALWAAASEEIVEGRVQGEYIVPDKKISKASKQGRDDALAEQLWALTDGIIRDKLGVQAYMQGAA